MDFLIIQKQMRCISKWISLKIGFKIDIAPCCQIAYLNGCCTSVQEGFSTYFCYAAWYCN